MDQHVSSEFARVDGLGCLSLKRGDERLVQRDCRFGPGRAAVRGPVAFPGTCEKRELAYDQNVPGNLLDGAIHYPVLVVKDAETGDFAAKPFEILGAICFLKSHKHEQAGPNSSFKLPPDFHTGLRYPLNYCAHSGANNPCGAETQRGRRFRGEPPTPGVHSVNIADALNVYLLCGVPAQVDSAVLYAKV